MVLSYPVFAFCISLTEPLIHLLIGQRYLASAPVLAILALGYFFSAVMGLNIGTLRALGKVRMLLYIDIACILLALLAALALVPAYGTTGGALATAAAMMAQVVLSSLALWRITGNNPMPWFYARAYLITAACTVGLWLPRLLGIDSLTLDIVLLVMTSLLVIFSCRKLLSIVEIFPRRRNYPVL